MMMSAKVELWPDCRRNQPLGAQRAGIVHVSAGRPIVGQQDVGRSGGSRRRDLLRSIVGEFLSADFSASALCHDFLPRGLCETLFFWLAPDPGQTDNHESAEIVRQKAAVRIGQPSAKSFEI